MDLHVYRNSQDRWHDLRSAARDCGAVLAVNAVTVDELVQRLTPDVQTATPGQRLAALIPGQTRTQQFTGLTWNSDSRYSYDAVAELKSARIHPRDLRAAGATMLADLLEDYDAALRAARLYDPQDRRAIAASRVRESTAPWLQRFRRVVLHALYDLTEAEFFL